MSEIDLFFQTTLFEFQSTVVIPFVNETVTSLINTHIENWNVSYLSEVICNDRGYFVPNNPLMCQCDIGFFDLYCKSDGVSYWGAGWTAFKIIFAFFYAILSVATWYYYVRKLLGEGNCIKTILRLIIVPKYLIIENLILISNTRLLFLVIDPFGQKEVFSYQASRVLYELIYGSLVAFYLCMLIIWIGVYTSFKMDLNPLTKLIKKKEGKRRWCTCSYQRVKIICIVILVLIFPLQIFFSYYVCDRETLNDNINSIIYLIVFVVLVVIGFTVYYTFSLRSTLNKKYRSNAHSEQIEVKVLYSHGNDAKEKKTDKAAHSQALTDKELIDFLDEMYQKNCVELVDCIIDKEGEGCKENDVLDSLDIEKEKKHFDDIELNDLFNKKSSDCFMHQKKDSAREVTENDPLHISSPEDNTSLRLIKSSTQRGNKADKSSIELMELTATDMKNLDLIFYISYFILISTLLVFVFVTMIGFNIHTDKPKFVIWIIVFQFVFELCGFFAIFYLFVRDIKTQEYENLKSLAEIENFHKQKEESEGKGLLHFKGISRTEVWGRFQSYISLHHIDSTDSDE